MDKALPFYVRLLHIYGVATNKELFLHNALHGSYLCQKPCSCLFLKKLEEKKLKMSFSWVLKQISIDKNSLKYTDFVDPYRSTP